jgi:hypothetical protein
MNAPAAGGAIGVEEGAKVSVRETVVAGNNFGRGSAVTLYQSSGLVLESCSIIDNIGGWAADSVFGSQQPITPQLGAGLWCGGSCSIHNTIIWDSSPETAPRVFTPAFPNSLLPIATTATYSNIKGSSTLPGAGNLAIDPQLLPGPSFKPAGGSPMIDAGNPDGSANGDTLDYAGAPRVQRGRQDIGALETANTAPTLAPNFPTSIGLGRRQVCAWEGAEGPWASAGKRWGEGEVDVHRVEVGGEVSGGRHGAGGLWDWAARGQGDSNRPGA